MSAKILIKTFPEINTVEGIIGEKLSESLIEVLNLHEEAKSLIRKFAVLKHQLKEASESADEYLQSELHSINSQENRRFIVHGIEHEMTELVQRSERIKAIFNQIFNPEK